MGKRKEGTSLVIISLPKSFQSQTGKGRQYTRKGKKRKKKRREKGRKRGKALVMNTYF